MDEHILPVGDRGVTTLQAKGKELMIPALEGGWMMVIPKCWTYWITAHAYYSRSDGTVWAETNDHRVYELFNGAAWVEINGR